MGFPSVDPSSLGAFPDMSLNMPPPQQSGMFGGGGHDLRSALMAAAAGFMARRSPQVSGNIINGLQDAQTLKQKVALAEQQRQQQLQDQIALHQSNRDYDVNHAPPPDIQDRIATLEKLQPGLGLTYAKNYAQNGGGMGPMLTNPLTGQQMVPAGKAAAQDPPAEAVARLKSNPGEASQFDEIFGPGTSAKFLGGPTQPASGNFL